MVERGLAWLGERVLARSFNNVTGLHLALQAIYGDHRILAVSAIWHSVSWVAGVGEVWIILALLGVPIGRLIFTGEAVFPGEDDLVFAALFEDDALFELQVLIRMPGESHGGLELTATGILNVRAGADAFDYFRYEIKAVVQGNLNRRRQFQQIAFGRIPDEGIEHFEIEIEVDEVFAGDQPDTIIGAGVAQIRVAGAWPFDDAFQRQRRSVAPPP